MAPRTVYPLTFKSVETSADGESIVLVGRDPNGTEAPISINWKHATEVLALLQEGTKGAKEKRVANGQTDGINPATEDLPAFAVSDFEVGFTHHGNEALLSLLCAGGMRFVFAISGDITKDGIPLPSAIAQSLSAQQSGKSPVRH